MKNEKKRYLKEMGLVGLSLLFCWLYIPHVICYYIKGGSKGKIGLDVEAMLKHRHVGMDPLLGLIYFLHTNRYFRSLYYFRIGPIASMIIGWYRPGDRYFTFAPTSVIEGGMFFAHPYSTGINAEYIGKNFTCLQCSTVGKSDGKRPTIGDNVVLGAHSCVLGGVKIGNNAVIGGGSAVRENVPPYAVVIGNPAKVIGFTKSLDEMKKIESEKPQGQGIPEKTLEKNYNKYYLNRLEEIADFTII